MKGRTRGVADLQWQRQDFGREGAQICYRIWRWTGIGVLRTIQKDFFKAVLYGLFSILCDIG